MALHSGLGHSAQNELSASEIQGKSLSTAAGTEGTLQPTGALLY